MILTLQSQFNDDDSLTSYLADELKNSRLALILGSGISADFKLPTWDALIDSCCKEKNISIRNPRPDNLDLAEDVRIACNDNQRYLDLVKAKLFDGVDISFQALCSNKTLSALGALVMSSVRGSVSNVITYNFDDLLELYLDYHGFKTHVVSDLPVWNETADVRIIHPHGYLPSHPRHNRTNWIVFDRESYSARAALHLIWMEEQLPVLRRNTCLFVGLSPRDEEIGKLVAHVKNSHPCKSAGVPFWAIRFSTSSGDSEADRRDSIKMSERGIFLKFVSDYHTALPSFLFAICQKAAGVTL